MNAGAQGSPARGGHRTGRLSTLRLGLRFSLRGAREGRVRLILTTLGIAVAVALLLFTVSGFNGLKARDSHGGWLQTGTENRRPSVDESTSDALWWRLSSDSYDGQAIAMVEVAATGPRSPLLPGMDRLPGPGEYYVSPALATLLDSTPADQLGDRFSGTRAGILGRQALASPESLIIVTGRTPAEMEQAQAMQVRSIETAPKFHDYSDFLRIALGIGAIGLMLPVLVFVMTSTRLAAARREERLAALRLIGATPGQVNIIAAVEAVLAAMVGTALGFVLFYVFRPQVAKIPFTGQPFFTRDLGLGWSAIVGAAVGVPVVAVIAGLITLRRVQISPLGVTRKAPARRPRAISLLVPATGIGLLLIPNAINGSMRMYYIYVVFAFIALGIVLVGPWLTYLGSRLMAAFARRDSTLIAARRLGSDPRRGFRAISGLVLAVFMGTVFVALIAAAVNNGSDPLQSGGSWGTGTPGSVLPGSTVIQDFSGSLTGYPDAAATGRLVTSVQGISGVRAVVPVVVPYRLPTGDAQGDGVSSDGTMVFVSAAGWASLGGSPAAVNGSGSVALDVNELSQGRLVTLEGSMRQSAGTAELIVLTDGTSSAVERARTALEVNGPGPGVPHTVAETNLDQSALFRLLGRLVYVGVILCLLIAGCSLAVSLVGGLVERRRAFALLRLTGMPVSHLYRAVLLEAAVPLLLAAASSAAAGFLVAALIIRSSGGGLTLIAPGVSYFALVAGGIVAALAVVGLTLPLVGRMTDPQAARME